MLPTFETPRLIVRPRTIADVNARLANRLKRLPRVPTEMALHVLAYDFTRAMNLIGIQPLLRR